MNDQTNRRKRQHIEVIGRDEGVERNGRFLMRCSYNIGPCQKLI